MFSFLNPTVLMLWQCPTVLTEGKTNATYLLIRKKKEKKFSHFSYKTIFFFPFILLVRKKKTLDSFEFRTKNNRGIKRFIFDHL